MCAGHDDKFLYSTAADNFDSMCKCPTNENFDKYLRLFILHNVE